MTDHQQIARTILAQLGGNQFCVMTGAKNFVTLGNSAVGLRFALPRMTGPKINRVTVELTPADTYKVTFDRFDARALSIATINEIEDVYAEDLRGVFESATGLRTSLTQVFGSPA